MTIAPVICAIEVKAPPARAFELFTRDMGRWWPRGRSPARNPHAAIVVEPRAGGRWFEADDDGTETLWGQVVAWDPPHRLVLGWQLGMGWTYEPGLLTEVELTFSPTPSGGTLVRLEHRDLERFGDGALERAESVRRGWPERLADFAAHCGAVS